MMARAWRLVLLTAVSGGLVGCAPNIGAGDGAYTILLKAFTGPDHVTHARSYKDKTEKLARWKGLYVVHRAGHSDLCWGSYADINAAGPDLKKAKALRSDLGHPVCPLAMVIPLPGKHVGPPEWDISATADKGAYYTVLVAIFYDVPEATIDGSLKRYVGRRKFAVDLCRKLRKEGYEAYYDHGPVRSNVMIGAFAESAVCTVRKGRVATSEIVDPRVGQVLANPKFRYLAVNNQRSRRVHEDPRTGKTHTTYEMSALIRIPRRKGANAPTRRHRPGDAEPREAP